MENEPGFKSSLILHYRSKPIDGKWFRLVEPLDYVSVAGVVYRVPIGVNTDFASIPRGLRNIIPRVGTHGKAAVLHDWLCEFNIVPREEADRLFLEAMKILKVRFTRRRVMYSAVAGYTFFRKLLRK